MCSRPPVRCGYRSQILPVVLLAGVVATLSGCDDRSSAIDSDPLRFERSGPHPVGNSTVVVDAGAGRSLTVEIWYPADRSEAARAAQGAPVEEFFADPNQRAQWTALLAASPPEEEGPTRRTHSARDARPEPGDGWPVLVFSHCAACTRFSSFSVAEHLASHGFAVAAPDHVGGTYLDDTEGLTAAFLQRRALDVSAVLDVLLDPGASALPPGLRGRFDAARAGVFGHSYGAVTIGLVLQEDPRFAAGAALAAPPENPLLPGVSMANIAEPLLFLVAREDNSITELGNVLIRQNFTLATPPSWKVEVADAGHWDFSDLCALGGTAFLAGCGDGIRQTIPGQPFRYLPVRQGLDVAAAYVTAFFAATLEGDATARAYLSTGRPAELVAVESRSLPQ